MSARQKHVVAVAITTWVGLALFSWWAGTSWPQIKQSDPSLPLVYVEPGFVQDVRSSIPWLIFVLAIGVGFATLLEFAKFAAAGVGGVLPYFLGLLSQAVIVLDVLRLSAPDWWTFFLILMGISEYHRGRPDEMIPLSGMPFPLPSLLTLMLLILAAYRSGGLRQPTGTTA